MDKPSLNEQIQAQEDQIRESAISTLALCNAAIAWRPDMAYTWGQLYHQEKARIYQRIAAALDAQHTGNTADPDPVHGLVERGERVAIGPQPRAHVRPEAMETRVQELAAQVMRLRAWQAEAATVLRALRRHANGQETLSDGPYLSYWLSRADALTEHRVLDEGADWRPT